MRRSNTTLWVLENCVISGRELRMFGLAGTKSNGYNRDAVSLPELTALTIQCDQGKRWGWHESVHESLTTLLTSTTYCTRVLYSFTRHWPGFTSNMSWFLDSVPVFVSRGYFVKALNFNEFRSPSPELFRARIAYSCRFDVLGRVLRRYTDGRLSIPRLCCLRETLQLSVRLQFTYTWDLLCNFYNVEVTVSSQFVVVFVPTPSRVSILSFESQTQC